MQVTRMPLPGPATIVVFGSQRQILVDASLTRDQAALAIQAVMPYLHPDVIDHWLDRQYERRKIPFTARQFTQFFGAALIALAILMPIQPGSARPQPRIPATAHARRQSPLVAPDPVVDHDGDVAAELVRAMRRT